MGEMKEESNRILRGWLEDNNSFGAAQWQVLASIARGVAADMGLPNVESSAGDAVTRAWEAMAAEENTIHNPVGYACAVIRRHYHRELRAGGAQAAFVAPPEELSERAPCEGPYHTAAARRVPSTTNQRTVSSLGRGVLAQIALVRSRK